MDEYLADCKELGREPNQPFKGSFNVRIGSELHRKATIRAAEQGIKLNEFIKNSIEKAVA